MPSKSPKNFQDAFINELRREGKSDFTISAYRESVRDFEAWWNREGGERGPLRPERVTVHDVRAYRSYLVKAGRAPATINKKISGLCAFFRVAHALRWTATDPSRDVGSVREVRPAPRSLDRKSVHRLMRAVYASQNRRDIAIMEVLLNTGIRVSELVNLTLEDLTLKERKGAIRVRAGKREVFRSVPLNADARRAIAEYLRVRPASSSSALFLSRRGNKMNNATAFRAVQRYGRDAEIPLSPHVLRHTFGARMVREQKADLVLVARLLGHQDVNTTALYAEPTEEDLAQAVEGLATAG